MLPAVSTRVRPREAETSLNRRRPATSPRRLKEVQPSHHERNGAAVDRDLFSGLIRLHILHHAEQQPIFGLAMIEELSRHGYRLSAGTLYPLLHSLEAKGYLRSVRQKNGRRIRRMYAATPAGRRALAAARSKVRELFGELFEA
jgi:DNA-binding PadR family transcriptional regulator